MQEEHDCEDRDQEERGNRSATEHKMDHCEDDDDGGDYHEYGFNGDDDEVDGLLLHRTCLLERRSSTTPLLSRSPKGC